MLKARDHHPSGKRPQRRYATRNKMRLFNYIRKLQERGNEHRKTTKRNEYEQRENRSCLDR
ncbi:hypothetical protein D0784_23345 [Vibrio campbellii]|nr:hypothetical protein D0784_23345 [Vibrio campbellii]